MADGDEARVRTLLARMERFANGVDCSLEAARAIEGHIATLFDEDDELQELAEMLAQYRPEGGDYLYSEVEARPEMARRCEVMRLRLAREGSDPPPA